MARQHRAIEDSLRRALSRVAAEGGTQDAAQITVRGERFVIPVKAEFKRKVGGVVHGSSSTGQTVFIEPLETIEENNELVRLLDEEQAEVHRILVAMTRALAVQAPALLLGAAILAEADAHQAVARFAEDLGCVRPVFVVADVPEAGPPPSAKDDKVEGNVGWPGVAGFAASAAGTAAAGAGRQHRSARDHPAGRHQADDRQRPQPPAARPSR